MEWKAQKNEIIMHVTCSDKVIVPEYTAERHFMLIVNTCREDDYLGWL